MCVKDNEFYREELERYIRTLMSFESTVTGDRSEMFKKDLTIHGVRGTYYVCRTLWRVSHAL